MEQDSTKAREDLLRATASAFCETLLDPPRPDELLRKFFVCTNPCITEHGPEWARSRLPFLAKTFLGLEGCEAYFSILSQTLTMQMDKHTFPSSAGYIVDAKATTGDSQCGVSNRPPKGAVSVVGKASFTSIKTGKQWHEQFIYRFSGFDEVGRIGHWEIWADPLSAWVAMGEN
jgi:hypothetical protein